MKRLAKKVLLIGWDGADWKIINKLLDEGKMPTLEKLVNEGIIGNLATLEPPFSPMLWTTIATGKRPEKHGILGFTEPNPDQIGVRPVSSTSRKVKAIWNITTQNNIKSHVIGWWPSHPAEPINGIMISNYFPKASDNKNWRVPIGAVYPEKYTRLFSEIRVHPGELTQEHILPFVPKAEKVDQENDDRLSNIAKIIAETSTLHSAATWIMENQEWEFVAIYLDAIDHFCHGFMNFYPPKLPTVPDDLFDIYQHVIEGAYIFHDMMLERLVQLAGQEATIMIVSDHGFHSDHLRPKVVPNEPAGPAHQHRDYGIICMKGPGIKKDERIYGASLLNITPTLLTLFGLPNAEDMDGAPLITAFQDDIKFDIIKSWEDIPGYSGMHPQEIQEDPIIAQEALKQLIELGYIEEPNEDSQKAAEQAAFENRYNLARSFIGAGNYLKAKEILEDLHLKEKNEIRIISRLADTYKNIGEYSLCKDFINSVSVNLNSLIRPEQEMIDLMNESIPENISKNEREKILKQRKKILSFNREIKQVLVSFKLILAEIEVIEGNFELGIQQLKEIETKIPQQKSIFIKIGNIYLKAGKYDDAIINFEKVLQLDEESFQGFLGLAQANLKQKSFKNAAEYALNAISLIYYFPLAHYYLGEALYQMKDYENAANAFEVTLTMAPDYGKARNLLIEIYTEKLKQSIKAQKHIEYFQKVKSIDTKETRISKYEKEPIYNSEISERKELDNCIYVVSGLPRSGTSMMMQILEKGGLEIYTDKERKADENNPKGYFEHEAVKRLARDKKWLEETKGKVIKIISHLLFYLPSKYNYKIIFMQRNIKEIIASQQKMLEKEGKSKKDFSIYPLGLEKSFLNNLEKVKKWHSKNYNVDIMYINYSDVIQEPETHLLKIKNFIKKDLDVEAMKNAIDANLYRNKI